MQSPFKDLPLFRQTPLRRGTKGEVYSGLLPFFVERSEIRSKICCAPRQTWRTSFLCLSVQPLRFSFCFSSSFLTLITVISGSDRLRNQYAIPNSQGEYFFREVKLLKTKDLQPKAVGNKAGLDTTSVHLPPPFFNTRPTRKRQKMNHRGRRGNGWPSSQRKIHRLFLSLLSAAKSALGRRSQRHLSAVPAVIFFLLSICATSARISVIKNVEFFFQRSTH